MDSKKGFVCLSTFTFKDLEAVFVEELRREGLSSPLRAPGSGGATSSPHLNASPPSGRECGNRCPPLCGPRALQESATRPALPGAGSRDLRARLVSTADLEKGEELQVALRSQRAQRGDYGPAGERGRAADNAPL